MKIFIVTTVFFDTVEPKTIVFKSKANALKFAEKNCYSGGDGVDEYVQHTVHSPTHQSWTMEGEWATDLVTTTLRD